MEDYAIPNGMYLSENNSYLLLIKLQDIGKKYFKIIIYLSYNGFHVFSSVKSETKGYGL